MSNKKTIISISLILLSVLLIFLTYYLFSGGITKDKESDFPRFSLVSVADESAKFNWKGLPEGETMKLLKQSETGEFVEIATLTAKDKFYVDEEVKIGSSYSYKLEYHGNTENEPDADKALSSVSFKVEDFQAPALISLSTFDIKGGKVCGRLTFKSEPGKTYKIIRKSEGGEYKIVGTVTAKSEESSYEDNTLPSNGTYVYSARECSTADHKFLRVMGSCDQEGISSISYVPEGITLDATNLNAQVKWKPSDKVDGFVILRKLGKGGAYKIVGSVGKDTTSFTDVYSNSLKTDKEKQFSIGGTTFIDPSYNPMVYTVRGLVEKDGKKSYGRFSADGDFNRTTPSITHINEGKKNTIEIQWGTVPNASKYIICSGVKSGSSISWKEETEVKAQSSVLQSLSIPKAENATHYTVKAVFTRNGNTVYSDVDDGFDIGNRKYEGNHVLFLGDGITFGAPYKSDSTCNIFSYPYRVSQLTGIKYYNPSIPGATYGWKSTKDESGKESKDDSRYRMSKDVVEKLYQGLDVERPYPVATKKNTQRLEDFDVVILAGGTNDYMDCIPMASDPASLDINTFNGSINQILKWIEESSLKRISQGKAPTKVVFIDLFYSDRLGTKLYGERHSRFTSKNKLGLTLMDYQNEIIRCYERYSSGHNLSLYRFSTSSYIDQSNCKYNSADNLNMTRHIYGKIGNGLASFLIDNNIITQ